MKVKVCGMMDAENIRELSELNPDYMGFIFYPGSKRYVAEIKNHILAQIPLTVKKTGVFVNESLQNIMQKAVTYNLQAIQLHGNEEPEFCKMIQNNGIEVIKAFGIDETFDFNILDAYADATNYFLFDTKTSEHGGSGRSFNWGILNSYRLNVPYFLSGGLNPKNIAELSQINDERLYCADLNSGFETSPGMKNINELKKAINLLR